MKPQPDWRGDTMSDWHLPWTNRYCAVRVCILGGINAVYSYHYPNQPSTIGVEPVHHADFPTREEAEQAAEVVFYARPWE